MINIYVNSKFKNQKLTGVQRVAKDLIDALEKKEVKLSFIDNPYSGFLGHLYEQFIIPFILPKDSVLLSPINTGPILCRNQLLILHDVAFMDHPKWFSKSFIFFYKLIVPTLVKRVDAVVTISEFSKSRIVTNFKFDTNKISVIPNGIDLNLFNLTPAYNEIKILEKIGVESCNYVLTVCSLEPRKNLKNLLLAWKISAFRKNGFKLVLVGTKNSNFSNEDYDVDDTVIFTGYVSDSELPSLYRQCHTFVYVSLYEGFGLPPLEALASGVPVVVSNNSSLPEVISHYGIYVSPQDIQSIAQGLDSALYNPLKYCKSDYHNYAATFNWDSSASAYLSIINKGYL